MTTITENTPIIEKIRAGRRAALSSLHVRLGHTDKVVSIFDNAFPPRVSEPEFRSVRTHQPVARVRRPALVQTDNVAA